MNAARPSARNPVTLGAALLCLSAGGVLGACDDNSDNNGREPGDDTGVGDVGPTPDPCDDVVLSSRVIDVDVETLAMDLDNGRIVLRLDPEVAQVVSGAATIYRYDYLADFGYGDPRPGLEA